MAEKTEFPLVEVAVTLITRGDQILADYNPKWGSFTLPMTKRRTWIDPAVAKNHHEEDWLDAAARATVEWLGRTCEPTLLLKDLGEYQQSDRDGTWRRYQFRIFRVPVQGETALVPGAIAEWLTPAEFQSRRPISPTAQYLIAKLQENEKL